MAVGRSNRVGEGVESASVDVARLEDDEGRLVVPAAQRCAQPLRPEAPLLVCADGLW